MLNEKPANGSACSFKAEIGLCFFLFLMTQHVQACENEYPVEEKKIVLHPLMNGFMFIKRSVDSKRDQRSRSVSKMEDRDGDYPIEQVFVRFNSINYIIFIHLKFVLLIS